MTTENVTHRLVRHATHTITGSRMVEGREAEPFSEIEWFAHCACGDVFMRPTELECSAAYLAHLPKPTTLTKRAPSPEGK